MHGQHKSGGREMYTRLAVMILLSFIWMYAAMFAMVNVLGDVQLNVNSAYMAALMAGAMIPIELLLMRAMYRDRRLNLAAGLLSVAVLAGSFLAIRAQIGVGEDQFIRSMIPHHSSAILMCQQASIQDREIVDLCGEIVSSQQREIDQMKDIIERRSGR
jgi:uncharacterized protein (DUF305 family)